MLTQKLATHYVEKPWGRTDLPAIFADAGPGRQIGEAWFESADGRDLPLLVKYIFTSERLSIQVHPDDAQARDKGLARGKEEIWYILDCEPGATLGIGLTASMTPDQFRAAAQDGSLERWIDWKPVKPGDCYFIPAGTVHAIGAGITLAEIQQNADVTYRLYDYGRPRELHLDDGVAVSRLTPYDRAGIQAPLGSETRLIDADEAPFSLDLVHWTKDQNVSVPEGKQMWFTPISGVGTVNGLAWESGDCLLLEGDCAFTLKAGPVSALLAIPR
ncbi:class I mannose-6-phosphate isomerase [Sphingobium sp. TCM1]|uniref:class I mannose-6-phosphate isomerase n=1 Tax=Sphingobium sp. TCM1 TaxID=453246 RepID=UPI0007F3B900|nr:class I mannose-6-phosphate isomerase [Sphingobium sp. TCM1]OAN55682.1 phosphoheptose isomerase [Sphingobium sp. TCM1]